MDGEKLISKFSSLGQGHVTKFWTSLNEEEKQRLSSQLVKIDLEEAIRFFEKCTSSNGDLKDLGSKMKAVDEENTGGILAADPKTLKDYFQKGLEKVGAGEVGVILLAGGQGTRLGVSYPKGQFDVGLLSHKSLFQLQAERILRLQHLAEKTGKGTGKIMWYIMTSEATRSATESGFESNDYFGLSKSQVVFFDQGQLPCFTFDKQCILSSKSSLAMAPDGNGGLYRALGKSGALDHIEKSGVKYLHVYCVDNILVRVADPYFIGFCISKDADCGAKVVERKDPNEPVGVVCVVGGVGPRVVEYSEIPRDLAVQTHPSDPTRLAFRAGNICNHFFTTAFLKDVVQNKENSLVHHVAKKKIPFVDEAGNTVTPSTPNGIKMEKFVFDVFQFSKKFVVWEVVREEEFSPLKNANSAGKDCPSTCRDDTYRLHAKWLRDAKIGLDIPEKEGEVPAVEISPLQSYCGEGLAGGKLMSEGKVSVPLHLSLENNNSQSSSDSAPVCTAHIPLDAQNLDSITI